VAQLVERNLAKVEVAGSIPVIRSRTSQCKLRGSSLFQSNSIHSSIHGPAADTTHGCIRIVDCDTILWLPRFAA
jgi:hypothetical protein